MKKTLTINLSGIVFNIDEDAYEKLGNYLNTIKRSFSDSDGRDEIMADIEARIAEMFQEKVGQNKQVVTIDDIDKIISVMGKPEEFAGEGASQQQSTTAQPGNTYYTGRRRIFRDPDDRILGGVCSGIGSYFDINPIWLRLAFAGAFFCFGAGLLLYIILWIIIPQAKTSADKLEMRGQPVNIDNIGKTINEEVDHLKRKVNNFKNEMGLKENKDNIRRHANRFTDFVSQLFGGIVRVFGKIFAVFIIIVGSIVLFSLLASLFGMNAIHLSNNGTLDSYSIWECGNLIFNSQGQMNLALIGGSLLLGIPFLAMVYGGFKILFGIKSSNKILKYTFTILWLAGLFISMYVGINIGKDFSKKAKSVHNFYFEQPKSAVLYLKAKNNRDFDMDADGGNDNHETVRINNKKVTIHNGNKWDLINFNNEKITLAPPVMNIIQSETDSFELIVTSSARGETQKEAMNRAKKIKYTINQKDSVLEFDYAYNVDGEDKWRAQEVTLTLKVPKNKMIFIDNSMKHIIYDIQNSNNTLDEDMVNRRWIMGSGELKCIDCKDLDSDNNSNDKVTVNSHGIHIRSDDDKVNIDSAGINIEGGDRSVKINWNGIHIKDKK